jgi:hypothetical protein
VFTVQAYQTLKYVVPCSGIFLNKWHNSFRGNSDGKMNVQSACTLNTRYLSIYMEGPREIMKNLRIASFKTEIQEKHVLYTRVEHYC